MLVLGIESSCDETAAALVRDGRDVRSSIVLSQIAKHQPFGGVVPELASRAHVEAMPAILRESCARAGCTWADIDAVAVTRGPGLASSLLIGAAAARALALSLDKPLLPVNHLEGHLCSVFLDKDCPPPADVCPMVLLLVSGGHTLLLRVRSVGDYEVLARTLDDAAGEALDKGAKLMGLGYPGGPAIEKVACGGNRERVPFPRGTVAAQDGAVPPFSFSGLKTSLLYYIRKNPGELAADRLPDVAAGYQEAVFGSLLERAERALEQAPAKTFALVGGVARNQRLRELLGVLCARHGVALRAAPMEYCTDNAAMIACVPGLRPVEPVGAGGMDVDPNWPLAGIR